LVELPEKLPGDPPSAPNGEPNGPSNTDTSALGEPDTLPLTFCRVCQLEVKPEGKGRCSRCGTFLRLNFVARKGPVNVLRRDALLAELVAEYQPRTVGTRATCEQYAATLERLETTKPGSTEWQRLITVAQTLGSALDESRSSRVAPVPTSALSLDEVAARAERTLAMVALLREHKEIDVVAGPLVQAPAPTADPAPEPRCTYGCGTLARCAEMKATNYEAWEAIHGSDPEVVKKRDDLATTIMMKQIGKPHPWL
jgi:hypothetical protein